MVVLHGLHITSTGCKLPVSKISVNVRSWDNCIADTILDEKGSIVVGYKVVGVSVVGGKTISSIVRTMEFTCKNSGVHG